MEFSDSDYCDLASDLDMPSLASEPDVPNERKRSIDEPLDLTELWLAVRLGVQGMHEGYDWCDDWHKVTHFFIEDGLDFNNGLPSVNVVSTSRIPLCFELKRKYPHLKIVWCMPNQMEKSDELDRALGTNPFWDQLANLKVAVGADLIELNLECVSMKYGAVPTEGWRDSLILVLPNSIRNLKYHWSVGLLMQIFESVKKVVINSFGMMEKERVYTPHGYADMIKCASDCGLKPFDDVITLMDSFKSKILVGIDTQAVRYLLDTPKSEYFCKFELLSRRALWIEKDVGYRPPGDTEKRVYKYRSTNCPHSQGTLLELRRKKVLVSYDSIKDLEAKADYVVSNGLGGFVIGNLENDLPLKHRQSILHVIRKQVFEQ